MFGWVNGWVDKCLGGEVFGWVSVWMGKWVGG